MIVGAFQPDKHLVQIESVYVNANDPAFAAAEIRRISAAGRTPMVTVEPWERVPGPTMLREWGRVLSVGPRVFVRYMHEPNGDWYGWSGRPTSFHLSWAEWDSAMPAGVSLVWNANVSYPGSRPLHEYFPGRESCDWVSLDGYARHGESMQQVFEPSLRELRELAPGKPVMIAETGCPRGKGQARWWREGLAWAANAGIAAVVAFSQDKSRIGGDERNWELSPAAWKALAEAS